VDWTPAADQVDMIAEALRTHLQRRYGCVIPDAKGVSTRLRHHRGDLTLKVLALCAQAESGGVLSADLETQRVFVNAHSHILDEPDPQIPLQATEAHKIYGQLLRMRQQYRNASQV
jgi:hypothetical protein